MGDQTIPFLRAYNIWTGGSPSPQPFYYIVDRIKKDPTSLFVIVKNSTVVKCDVGLICIEGRWVVNRKLFEKALQERDYIKTEHHQE